MRVGSQIFSAYAVSLFIPGFEQCSLGAGFTVMSDVIPGQQTTTILCTDAGGDKRGISMRIFLKGVDIVIVF
jgi:hypothetical protein